MERLKINDVEFEKTDIVGHNVLLTAKPAGGGTRKKCTLNYASLNS